MEDRQRVRACFYVCVCVCVLYLLHALQSLLKEAELLTACVVLLTDWLLVFALFLLEEFYFVPVGVQLAAKTVILFL